MGDEQLLLFDVAAAARSGVVDEERRRAPLARQGVARPPWWGPYYGAHHACDEGLRLTHTGGANAHLDPALYRRAYQGEQTLLCSACATGWRQADGMTGLPKRGPR